MTRVRRLGLTGTLALGAWGCLPAAHAQALVAVDIPAQALESALDAFALQARISLSLPTAGFGDLRSMHMQGAFTVEEGLGRLLAGTHLRAISVGPGAYRIIAAPPQTRETPSLRTEGRTDGRDVVVVSARRSVSAIELPRDVVQIDGDDVDAAMLSSDTGLAPQVSGLSFTNLGMGRDKAFLRGLSDGAFTGQTQSLTGIYFDNTRITYGAPDPDLRPIDLAGVEVLKGPQGALYGAGSLGGIIHLEPRRVNLAASEGMVQVAAEGTQSGGVGASLDAMLNQPVIDGVLGVRAVLYDQRVGGWLDNAGAGLRNGNKSHRSGGRLSVLAKIDEDWSVELTGVEQETSSRDSQYVRRTPGGYERTSAFAEPHDNDFAMAAVTVRGAWDWADFTSATSVIDHQLASRFEATGAFLDIPAAPGAGQMLDDQSTLSMVLNETRLTSPAGAIAPWFVGLFYADGDYARDVRVADVIGAAAPTPRYSEARSDQIDELAVFGEATWPIGDAWSLSTGLRLFRSSLKVFSDTRAAGPAVLTHASESLAETGVAPDVRLSFKPTRDMMVYLSAAEGYRAGGVNTGGLTPPGPSALNQPFQRYGGDELWTYEFGVRGSLFDNTLDYSGVVFRSDWRNLQSDALLVRGFSYTGNAGDARVVGVEVDARYRPASDLEFNLHLLANEPELSQPDASFPGVRAGGLPGAPEISGSLSARHDWQIALGGLQTDAFVEGAIAYTGVARTGFGAGQSIGDYITGELRAGISAGPWRVLAYVANMSDSKGRTFAIGNPYQPTDSTVTLLRPRAVGVSLRYDF